MPVMLIAAFPGANAANVGQSDGTSMRRLPGRPKGGGESSSRSWVGRPADCKKKPADSDVGRRKHH